jgi:hypothetical protein
MSSDYGNMCGKGGGVTHITGYLYMYVCMYVHCTLYSTLYDVQYNIFVRPICRVHAIF